MIRNSKNNKLNAIKDKYYAVRKLEFNPPNYKRFLKSEYYSFYSSNFCYCAIYIKDNVLYLGNMDYVEVLFYGEINEENYNKCCEMGKNVFLTGEIIKGE